MASIANYQRPYHFRLDFTTIVGIITHIVIKIRSTNTVGIIVGDDDDDDDNDDEYHLMD